MVTRFVAVAATAVGLNPMSIEQTKMGAPSGSKLLVFMTFTPRPTFSCITSRLRLHSLEQRCYQSMDTRNCCFDVGAVVQVAAARTANALAVNLRRTFQQEDVSDGQTYCRAKGYVVFSDGNHLGGCCLRHSGEKGVRL